MQNQSQSRIAVPGDAVRQQGLRLSRLALFCSRHMKNQKTKTAPATKKSSRKSGQTKPVVPPLLTVTLDAEASACVRRFAEEFGEDVRDVANGSILDTLPQALEEWDETKAEIANGKHVPGPYWQGTEEMVRDARKRRIAARPAGDVSQPLTRARANAA